MKPPAFRFKIFSDKNHRLLYSVYDRGWYLLFKPKFLSVVCILALCLLGCSGGSTSNVTSDIASGVSSEIEGYTDDMSKDLAMGEIADTDTAESDVNPNTDEQAKRTYYGNLRLETTSFAESQDYLYTCVSDAEGYLESDNTNQSSTYFSDDVALYNSDMTIRVPAENFKRLVRAIEDCEKCVVTYKSVQVDDISESYYDVKNRLKSYKVKLNTLRDLLADAENVTEILDIENAISNTQYEIESLQSQLNQYDSKVEYSVLNIQLYEVNVLSMSNKTAGYGSKLWASITQGFTSGINFISNLILFILQGWLLYVIVGIIICIIYKKTKPRRDAIKAEKKAMREEQMAVRKILSEGAAAMDEPHDDINP